MNNFQLAMDFIAKWEWSKRSDGGYTNDPVDPGGETKFGVAKKFHPEVDVKNLTLQQALEIYKKDYWDKYRCDDFEMPFAICVLDGYVQHKPVVQAKLIEDSDRDVATYIQLRRAFYQRLIDKNPALAKYKNGWNNRMTDLRKYCDIVLVELGN
jgi:hypothetical protein